MSSKWLCTPFQRRVEADRLAELVKEYEDKHAKEPKSKDVNISLAHYRKQLGKLRKLIAEDERPEGGPVETP